MSEIENTFITLATSAARTATISSNLIETRGHKGLLLIVDATAIAATPLVTPAIQAYDALSNAYYTYWTAAAAIATAVDNTYLIYPGAIAADSNTTETAGLPIPGRFRVVLTHGDADSITYSASLQLLA